jgi:hypothetical protein
MAARTHKRQLSRQKSGEKSRAVRRPSRGQKQAGQSHQDLERLPDLPAQSNAQSARQQALLQMQRHLGNAYVQRQIAEQEDKNRNLSTKGMGMTLWLEGHADHLAVQREDEASEEEAPPKPSVDISIKLNKPTIKYMSEKKVQQKHDREDIAGYTKPGINIGVPVFKPQKIKIVVTLDFFMDLASEYKGGRKQVLRDHEDSHILIAEKVAKEWVVDPLKDDIAEFDEFNQGNAAEVKGKFGPRLKDFEREEGIASQDYDDLDYPRMDEAYFGVATSLADLSSGSEEVKNMVSAMDAFNAGAKAAAGDAEALGGLTKAVTEAQEALGDTNLARLQYNKDFKKKVSTAQAIVAKLSKKPDKLAEGVKDKLDEISPALEKFTWKPEID